MRAGLLPEMPSMQAGHHQITNPPQVGHRQSLVSYGGSKMNKSEYGTLDQHIYMYETPNRQPLRGSDKNQLDVSTQKTM